MIVRAKYVCQRCGLNIGWWAKGDGGYWKHHASGTTGPCCGMPPILVSKETYDRDIQAMLDTVDRFLGL